MRIATLIFGLGIGLTACGGKIADDPNATPVSSPAPSTPAPSPSPSDSSTQGLAQPPTNTVADACGAICARNGRCGAQTSDCLESCTADITGAAGCQAEANAYVHCYADHLTFDGECAALPPVCESAYCAYAQCTQRVLPGYCH